MTLSPTATSYGYGPLPPQTAPMPFDMSQLAASVAALANSVAMLIQMMNTGAQGPAYGQALQGQNALGGGSTNQVAGCSMGSSCPMQDSVAGGGAVSGGGAVAPPSPGDVTWTPTGTGIFTPSATPGSSSPPPPPAPTAATPTPAPAPTPAPTPAPAPAPPPPAGGGTGQQAVDRAKSHLGTPYKWGGTGDGGFDCSGLVQSALKDVGINVPHNSGEQFKGGTPVDKQDLQPGDLVFFNGDPPGHVGMYVGNGEYIHAPQTGDVVKISKLDEHTGFVGARRYT